MHSHDHGYNNPDYTVYRIYNESAAGITKLIITQLALELWNSLN